MSVPKTSRSVALAERSFDWLTPGAVVMALGHFLSAMSPSVWTWGIDYWSVLPLWGQCLLLLLVAIAVLPVFPERIAAFLERRAWPHWSKWAAGGAAFALFLFMRSRGYSYGDGYSFRSYFASGALPPISGNLALMSGDLIVHWLVYRAAVMPLGGTVEIAYAIVNALAGVASVAAIAFIARLIYPKDRGARWTIIAAGFSSGMAVLWFGHVEAYSLVGAALLWSIAFLIRGRTTWAWGAWVVACLLHLLAVAYLPVLVWAMWGRRVIASFTPKRTFWLFLLGFVAWGIAGMVFSMIEPGIFVPVTGTEDSSYTAFSLAHLSDAANLLLFAAPLGLLGIIVWLARGTPSRGGSDDGAITMLAVASASLWYFSFWVDPLIGAFRDWDLIGVYGIPFSILGVVLLLRQTSSRQGVRPQWVVVAAFAIAHTGAFMLTIQDEPKAMDRVDRLVREDVHYSRDFHKGERLMSWSYLLTEILDRRDLAIDHLKKRSLWEPRDVKSWGNLGSLYWQMGRYDSAAASFEEALKLDDDEPKTYEQLAFSYSGSRNLDKAAETVEKLATLRPLKTAELNLWAFCLLMNGNDTKADSLLTTSISQEPDQQEAFYYRGIVQERKHDTLAALASYEQAMAPQTNVEDVYLRCARLYQGLLRWSDAERVATAWQGQFPNSAAAPFLVGICRVAGKQYSTARDALERAAVLDPNSALTQFYLATAYRNLGQPDRALAAAKLAAGIDSMMALPYLEMVYLAADAEDRPAAVIATREYLKRAPFDSGMSYLQQFMEP